jgi:hypothetical protein
MGAGSVGHRSHKVAGRLMTTNGRLATFCIGKTLKVPLYGVTTLTREEVENLLDSGQSNRRLRRAAAKLNVNTKEVANAA